MFHYDRNRQEGFPGDEDGKTRDEWIRENVARRASEPNKKLDEKCGCNNCTPEETAEATLATTSEEARGKIWKVFAALGGIGTTAVLGCMIGGAMNDSNRKIQRLEAETRFLQEKTKELESRLQEVPAPPKKEASSQNIFQEFAIENIIKR